MTKRALFSPRRTLWILFLLSSCAPLASGSGAEPPGDSLAELNAEFRAAYSRSRAEMLRRSGPVILFDGERLVFLRDGERREGTPVGAAYHHLKAVAHLPLYVFVELANEADGPLTADARSRVTALRKRIAAVDTELDRLDFAAGDREVQRRLVTRSARYLDGVLMAGAFQRAGLETFAAACRDEIDRNADVAAALELRHYQDEVAAWRKDLTDEAWRQVRVVVIGAQMPRRDNRVVQLFAALLGVSGEGRRIVYAEGLFETQRALNLLGTHLLDDAAATAFFGDAARLERDLLADGAAKYVREHVRRLD
jgi:hypothetical protein